MTNEMMRFCGECGIPFNTDSYEAGACLNCGQTYDAPRPSVKEKAPPPDAGDVVTSYGTTEEVNVPSPGTDVVNPS